MKTTTTEKVLKYSIILILLICPMILSAQFSVNVTTTDACNGDGTVTATPTAGDGPYTFEWEEDGGTVLPITDSIATGLSQGYHIVRVTGNSGTVRTRWVWVPSTFGGYPITTDEFCGDGTGTVTVGSLPTGSSYSFLWSNGSTDSIVTNLHSGNYLATVTQNSTGCVWELDSAYVWNNTGGFYAWTSASASTCGAPDGSITANVSGGSTPYSYSWSTGATTTTISGLVPGYYEVTVTDATGCEVTSARNLSTSSPINLFTTDYDDTCGQAIGWAEVSSVTGGTPPYTYAWSTGGTGPVITGLTSGSYTVTVTDAVGCVKARSEWVSNYNAIGLSVSKIDEVCSGSNGSASAIPGGAGGPFTYLWSTGATTSSISGLSAGTYSVTVSAGSCTEDVTINIFNDTSLDSVTATITPESCAGGDGSVTANVWSGTAPYTYNWSTGATTATISGLAAGTYTVTITDAGGCSGVRSFYVSNASASLFSWFGGYPEFCGNDNGMLWINGTSGGTAPYTYLWSTGSTNDSITGLDAGYYSVTVTDANGCTDTRGISINDTVPYFYTYIDSQAAPTCGMSDGYLRVTTNTTFGLTPPLTYTWASGATGPELFGVPAGWYEVLVADAGGCSQTQSIYFEPADSSCSADFVGKVYIDTDADCSYTAGTDYPYPGANVTITNSTGTFTQTAWIGGSGDYHFNVPLGTYTLTHTAPAYYNNACATGSITINATSPGTYSNDFIDTADGAYRDLAVDVWMGTMRPGFSGYNYIDVYNVGTTPESGTMELTHDAILNYSSILPTSGAYNASTNTATWSFTGLLPSQSTPYTRIKTTVPTTTPLGTNLVLTGSVGPTAGDVDLSNNIDTAYRIVTGSYDPNFKEVSPAGEGPLGDIVANTLPMTYTVHFQNTGTDTAFNIMIRDTLDSDLNLESFNPGASSHNYTATVYGNVVEFYFENIMLPDSNIDEANSHGMVRYSIGQKPGLPINTLIENTAYIYFDFNAPIITNTTVNRIVEPNAIAEPEQYVDGIGVYPNPASHSAFVSYTLYKGGATEIAVYDLAGTKVLAKQKEQNIGSYTEFLDTKNLAAGMYMVEVSVAGEAQRTKLIVIE